MKRSGFSLLELLAVVTIIGIIASIVVSRFTVNTDTAKEKVCRHNCAQINSAIEQFSVENGAWPANDLSDLAADPNYFPEGIPVCPVSGTAYTMDPTTNRVQGHNGSHP